MEELKPVLVMPSLQQEIISMHLSGWKHNADDCGQEAFEKIYKFSVNPPMLHTTVRSASRLRTHSLNGSVAVDSVRLRMDIYGYRGASDVIRESDGVIRATSPKV